MILLLLPFLLARPVPAAEIAGLRIPDTASVGGRSLVLNGVGLREKYYIDVYVGALYLPAKTRSGADAIAADVPKRIAMHFLYSAVTKDQLIETWREGFAKAPGAAAVQDRIDALCAMMTDVAAGDVVSFDYAPGTGTTVSVKGRSKGTLAGKDFMLALWSLYLGSYPPTAKLKTGMLGGGA